MAALSWLGWCITQLQRGHLGTLVLGQVMLALWLCFVVYALSDRTTGFGERASDPGGRVDVLTFLAVSLFFLLLVPLLLDLACNTALALFTLRLILAYTFLTLSWVVLRAVIRRQ